MTEPTPELYYDCTDSETTELTDSDEAVEEYLDQLELEDWPTTVDVTAYRRVTIKEEERERWATQALEHLTERLDDRIGAPDEDTELTPEMRASARSFVDLVISLYPSWRMEEAKEHSRLVSVASWVAENRPDWIKDDPEIKARVLALALEENGA